MDQKQKKVLIVEDDNDARGIFIEVLKDGGLEVVGAVDGNDALSKMVEMKFDLILLDIIMPNKDGITTLTEIKANPTKYGDADIYMLTNIDSDITIQKAVELGAKGYFLKTDLNPDKLIETVKKYLSIK